MQAMRFILSTTLLIVAANAFTIQKVGRRMNNSLSSAGFSTPKISIGFSKYNHVAKSSKLYQTPSLPSFEELQKQKSDALRSISEYHDGVWINDEGAISFDSSGGSKMRSSPFKTSSSTRLGLSADAGEALKMVETVEWGEGMIFGRSSVLGNLADVDSVDGSYSLHSIIERESGDDVVDTVSSCALPQSISGIDPCRISTVIESCLIATETERVRCFMLYGKSAMSISTSNDGDEDSMEEQRLLRIVISHERKETDGNDDFKSIIDDAVGNAENRMDKLASAMSGEDLGENIKHPINMMSLSMGPWLGDIVIRDKSFNSLLPKSKKDGAPKKGFGTAKKQTPPKRMGHESGFGEWVLGVQKVAMTFKYDFDCNCRQVFDYGKSIGVYVEGFPQQSTGVIYDEGMSRRIKPEDRSMYIDFDNGAYCGFSYGSVFIKAPRFLTSQRQGSALPMLTEFAIFQKPEPESGEELDESKVDDICCSRISRLYNDDGSLKQGCTSFFVLKPMVTEIDDNITP